MAGQSVAVSAPGKVLFTGGFLVLDRQHTGLVFGLNARIHVVARPWIDQSDNHASSDPNIASILVESPQFQDARWLYRIGPAKPARDQAIDVTQVVSDEEFTQTGNKFVETTLRYVLTYVSKLPKEINKSVKVTILADTDYYSQSQTAGSVIRGGFTEFGLKLSNAHKTGLGSSAALVTSLTSALTLLYTGDIQLPQTTIHNLAQAAHCAAQGKVGSGFDVAAAVFGSCVYRRFSPTLLERVGEASSEGFGHRLHLCVDDLDLNLKWDAEVSRHAVRMPNTLLLVMCDVDCGSETPGMVKKVLRWRTEQPGDASLLWAAIQEGSDDLCRQLTAMSDSVEARTDTLMELRDSIQTVRSLVREMSHKSNVPIEPAVITELLDYCTSLPGVIGGVAPGAGGYDAVALLLQNKEDVYQNLRTRLDGWSGQTAGAQIGRVRLLEVKQDSDGIRIEDASRYQEWLH